MPRGPDGETCAKFHPDGETSCWWHSRQEEEEEGNSPASGVQGNQANGETFQGLQKCFPVGLIYKMFPR